MQINLNCKIKDKKITFIKLSLGELFVFVQSGLFLGGVFSKQLPEHKALVNSIEFAELVMIALFDYGTLVQNNHLVSVTHSAISFKLFKMNTICLLNKKHFFSNLPQSVRNNAYGSVFHRSVNGLLYQMFRLAIECRRRFVKQKQFWIYKESASDCNSFKQSNNRNDINIIK